MKEHGLSSGNWGPYIRKKRIQWKERISLCNAATKWLSCHTSLALILLILYITFISCLFLLPGGISSSIIIKGGRLRQAPASQMEYPHNTNLLYQVFVRLWFKWDLLKLNLWKCSWNILSEARFKKQVGLIHYVGYDGISCPPYSTSTS